MCLCVCVCVRVCVCVCVCARARVWVELHQILKSQKQIPGPGRRGGIQRDMSRKNSDLHCTRRAGRCGVAGACGVGGVAPVCHRWQGEACSRCVSSCIIQPNQVMLPNEYKNSVKRIECNCGSPSREWRERGAPPPIAMPPLVIV